MFARFVRMKLKTSAAEFSRTLENDVIPLLRKQKGFRDELTFVAPGAKDAVALKRGEHFPHNYNYVNRAHMYSFFNRVFGLKLPEPIVEADYQPLTRDELTVWTKDHPRPAGGDDHESRRDLLAVGQLDGLARRAGRDVGDDRHADG